MNGPEQVTVNFDLKIVKLKFSRTVYLIGQSTFGSRTVHLQRMPEDVVRKENRQFSRSFFEIWSFHFSRLILINQNDSSFLSNSNRFQHWTKITFLGEPKFWCENFKRSFWIISDSTNGCCGLGKMQHPLSNSDCGQSFAARQELDLEPID